MTEPMTYERKDGQTLESYTIIALGQDVADLSARLAAEARAAEQALATVTAERDAAVEQTNRWKTLGDSVRADAASAAIFIAEVTARWQLKGPPKSEESPNHWHSLVYRLEQRLTKAEQQLAEVRGALEALLAVQNDAPLEKYRRDWEAAMMRAQAALLAPPPRRTEEA